MGASSPAYGRSTADGKTIISGLNDGSIMTWNTTTWQPISVLTEPTNIVYVTISPNDQILASASWGKARLWNLQNGQPTIINLPIQYDTNLPVNCISFSTDGKLLATGCYDNTATAPRRHHTTIIATSEEKVFIGICDVSQELHLERVIA